MGQAVRRARRRPGRGVFGRPEPRWNEGLRHREEPRVLDLLRLRHPGVLGLIRVTRPREQPIIGFEQRVKDVIMRLMPGEVVTYGEIAAEAGYPGAARAVGN